MGARVESASFSLLIPPLVNAFSTAAALGRSDIIAAASSTPLQRQDVAFLAGTFAGPFTVAGESVAVQRTSRDLPSVANPLSPFIEYSDEGDSNSIPRLVHELTERAVVPESQFPVAGLLVFQDGRAVPGVNVENTDWTYGLCAERNALGTMVSYGLTNPMRLYLTCTHDDACSPCGACRQLLVEIAPDASIIMDRRLDPAETATPRELLPGFFAGSAIPAPSHRGAKS